MKTLLTLIMFTLVPTVAFAQWEVAVDKLKNSVVFVENGQGSCTAFVINEEKNLVLTAAHCYAELKDMLVDGKPVTKIVARETKKDLLVLHVDGLDKPALSLAKNDPKTGDEVASNGFGYGLESALFKTHHVMADNLHIDVENIGGPLIAVDTSYLPGMSGGPLVNKDGIVIAIVQLGNPAVGFGVGAETIRDKVGRYFQFK